ncbi:MAG: hypothetical protein ACE367_15930 [Acidimicrobiales bacterium]
MNLPADLAGALLAAPLGVATLARLEWRAVDGEMAGGESPASTPAGVDAAVALVRSIAFAELIELLLRAETTDVGPWIGDASQCAASAYRDAEARRPIAEAVAARFRDDLQQSLDRSAQQFWTTAIDPSRARRGAGDAGTLRLGDFDDAYGAGQFTFGGLWTVTDPPVVLHEALVEVWEMYPGPVVRWHLPVRPKARVFEIHRPDDWVRLVTAYPAPAVPGQEEWELPGPNQSPMLLPELDSSRTEPTGVSESPPEPTAASESPMLLGESNASRSEPTRVGESSPGPIGPAPHLAHPPPPPSGSGRVTTVYEADTDGGWFRYSPSAEPTSLAAGWWAPHPEGSLRPMPVELFEVPGQNAARMAIRRHLVPDWASVARDWDGVHLSWAGLVTTEGFVSDLPDGDVAMLRYWFTERTLWLTDVFGEPEPLGAAEIEAELSNGATRPGALDLRTDTAAHERERRRLDRFLGR